MATIPPAETPTPAPDFDQPDMPGHEIDTPAPDTDVPAPQPDSVPNMDGGQPVSFAMPTSSDVGARNSGDTADIGGTDGMDASTGGMAGTSR